MDLLRSPWTYAAAGGFLAVAGATTLIKGGGSSGQRAQTQTLHRSWYYFSPGATYAIGPMTFDQPISATEFRRLVREQLGFSLPRGTEVWPTEAHERGGVRRTGRRDATPIWQDRNGRYQLFARGDQDFYLLDRMYSDRLTPEFSPDGRGIRWLGHAAEPVPISVSSAALNLHKAQRAARGVERYRRENPWREGRSGWGNQHESYRDRMALTPFLSSKDRWAVDAYITTGQIPDDAFRVAQLRRVALRAIAWQAAPDIQVAGRALMAKLDAERSNREGQSHQRADGTRRFHRAYLDATRVMEISGWRRWPNGVNTRLEEDRELGGLRLAGLNAPPGARKAVLAVATQLSAWAHEFDVLYMTSEGASTAIQMFLTDAEFREWYPDDYHSGRRAPLDDFRTALTPFLRADGRHDAVYAYITTGQIPAAAVALLRKVAKQAMAWKTAADTRAAGRALMAKLDAG